MYPVPAGYVWSFSGDTSQVQDIFGSVAGQVSCSGGLTGSVGLFGSCGNDSISVGSAWGRGKTIEQDDLEVMELLDLL